MTKPNLHDTILEAIRESQMLQLGLESRDEERMLFTAMKLSGAPYSFVEEVYTLTKKSA